MSKNNVVDIKPGGLLGTSVRMSRRVQIIYTSANAWVWGLVAEVFISLPLESTKGSSKENY